MPANEAAKIEKTTTFYQCIVRWCACVCTHCLADSYKIPQPADFHLLAVRFNRQDYVWFYQIVSFAQFCYMSNNESFSLEQCFWIILRGIECLLFILICFGLFLRFFIFIWLVFFISLIRYYLIAFYGDFLGRFSSHAGMWFIKFIFLNRRVFVTCLLK